MTQRVKVHRTEIIIFLFLLICALCAYTAMFNIICIKNVLFLHNKIQSNNIILNNLYMYLRNLYNLKILYLLAISFYFILYISVSKCTPHKMSIFI